MLQLSEAGKALQYQMKFSLIENERKEKNFTPKMVTSTSLCGEIHIELIRYFDVN